jgi:uncharacterized membrane protein HdeD (DUF308 family)
MNSAAKSVYYFGFYLLLIGVTLTAVPNFLLSMFLIPETNEVWIRIVGILAFNIGMLYIVMAQSNHKLFLTMTVYLRASILVWFILFVLIEWAPATLILFGVVDFAGALWTYLELKKQN